MNSNEVYREIILKLSDGRKLKASLVYRERDATCWLQLTAEGITEESTNTDYFKSFTDIRRRLAKNGIFPICYGASRKVWPSGMARDMGQGLKAYKLELGIKGGEMVGIFETGSDVEPVTPEEQQAFEGEWFRSMTKR